MIIFVSQPFDNAVAHKDSTKRPPAKKGFSLFTVFAWYLLILFTLKYFSIFARRSKKYTFRVILFSSYFYERKYLRKNGNLTKILKCDQMCFCRIFFYKRSLTIITIIGISGKKPIQMDNLYNTSPLKALL